MHIVLAALHGLFGKPSMSALPMKSLPYNSLLSYKQSCCSWSTNEHADVKTCMGPLMLEIYSAFCPDIDIYLVHFKNKYILNFKMLDIKFY